MSVRFCERTLSNGLRVIAEADPRAHSAAAGFFVRTGARDEPVGVMGVSHFLEHMMFKGPADLTAEALNAAMDDLGASNNAYTSSEMTCFYAHTLPEALPPACDLLARMLRPALRDEDFETERGVILEEIAMYDDNPFWVLLEAAGERHYRGHPLGHRVLGTRDTIGRMGVDEMRSYFQRRYTADATTVALAGRVDFDAMADALEGACEGWSRGSAPPRDAPAGTGAGRFSIERESVSRGYLLAVADAPPLGDSRRHAARILSQVLGAPGNSRLHWALIETGIADEAVAAYLGQDGVGEFVVFASGEPARLEEIERIVLDELAAAADQASPEDVARLRARAATGMTVGGERPADRMQRIGSRWAVLGEYLSLEEELDQLRAVTADDLRTLAADFPLTPTTIGVLRPTVP